MVRGVIRHLEVHYPLSVEDTFSVRVPIEVRNGVRRKYSSLFCYLLGQSGHRQKILIVSVPFRPGVSFSSGRLCDQGDSKHEVEKVWVELGGISFESSSKSAVVIMGPRVW